MSVAGAVAEQTGPSPEELYRRVYRIRHVEDAIERAHFDREMQTPTHLCHGQEAVSMIASAFGDGATLFSQLRAAPATITWPDHPVTASHGVEDRFYPGVSDIVDAVCGQMRLPPIDAPRPVAVGRAVATTPF